MNPYLSCYNDLLPVIAKNGAEVRELMPSLPHGNRLQSLAEATLYGGQRTQLHRHLKTEELYHVTAGQGTMVLGEQRFPITVGDTVVVPVGTPARSSTPRKVSPRAPTDAIRSIAASSSRRRRWGFRTMEHHLAVWPGP